MHSVDCDDVGTVNEAGTIYASDVMRCGCDCITVIVLVVVAASIVLSRGFL